MRPSVVCTPRGSLAMKPVITSVRGGACLRQPAARCSCCCGLCHCTAGPSGPHSTVTQRRASIHCTPRAPRAAADSAEQPRRPDLAKPAHRSRTVCAAERMMLVVCSTPVEVRRCRDRTRPGILRRRRHPAALRDAGVTLAHRPRRCRHTALLRLRQRHQFQQRVGDAFAGRQHDAGAGLRRRRALRLHDARDTLEAPRIGHTGAAKLMYHPGRAALPSSKIACGAKKLRHTTGASPIFAICHNDSCDAASQPLELGARSPACPS